MKRGILRKSISLVVVVVMFFNLIPASFVSVFAEELNAKENLKFKSISLKEDKLVLGEELIIEFNNDINPGIDFNLIKLEKRVEKQSVEVKDGVTIEVDRVPLPLQVGINEKFMKIAPSDEEYIANCEYILTIPKKSVANDEYGNLSEDIVKEFKVINNEDKLLSVYKEESKEDSKTESAEEIKEESKEDSKAESTEEIKEESKEDSKAESTEEIKEELKEDSKVESAEEIKEESKEDSKAESTEEIKEESKEDSKGESTEEIKEELKEDSKVESAEEIKEESKEDNEAEIECINFIDSKNDIYVYGKTDITFKIQGKVPLEWCDVEKISVYERIDGELKKIDKWYKLDCLEFDDIGEGTVKILLKDTTLNVGSEYLMKFEEEAVTFIDGEFLAPQEIKILIVDENNYVKYSEEKFAASIYSYLENDIAVYNGYDVRIDPKQVIEDSILDDKKVSIFEVVGDEELEIEDGIENIFNYSIDFLVRLNTSKLSENSIYKIVFDDQFVTYKDGTKSKKQNVIFKLVDNDGDYNIENVQIEYKEEIGDGEYRIVANFDKDVFYHNIDFSKIKIFKNDKLVSKEDNKGIGLNILCCRLEKSQMEPNNKYRFVIENGCLTSMFGKPIDFEYEFVFYYPWLDKVPVIIDSACYNETDMNGNEKSTVVDLSLDIDTKKIVLEDINQSLLVLDKNNESLEYTSKVVEDEVDSDGTSRLILTLDYHKYVRDIKKVIVVENQENMHEYKIKHYGKLGEDLKFISFDPIMNHYDIDIYEFLLEYNNDIEISTPSKIYLERRIDEQSANIQMNIASTETKDEEYSSLGKVECESFIDENKLIIRPKDYLKYTTKENEYNEYYVVVVEEGAINDTSGCLNKRHESKIYTSNYDGPIVVKSDAEQSTEFRNKRNVNISALFNTNIKFTDKEKLLKATRVYRISKEKKYIQELLKMPVEDIDINGNKLSINIVDYFNKEAVYKVEIGKNTILKEVGQADDVYLDQPIKFKVKVEDKEAPNLVNKDKLIQNMGIDFSYGKEVRLIFDEDVDINGLISLESEKGHKIFMSTKVIGNEVVFDPIKLDYDTSYKMIFNDVKIVDKNMNQANLTDLGFITIKFEKGELIGDKRLQFINSPIVIKFDNNIESIEDVELLSSEIELACAFFDENKLYLIPKIDNNAKDMKNNELILDNPYKKSYYYFLGVKKDSSKYDSKLAKKHNIERNKSKYLQYTDSFNITIPEGFVKFKNVNVPINSETKLNNISYRYEKETYNYRPSLFKCTRYMECVKLKYKDIDIDVKTNGIVNSNATVVNQDVTFTSKGEYNWSLGTEANKKHTSSFVWGFENIGNKDIVALSTDTDDQAFDIRNIDVVKKIDENNTTLEVIDNSNQIVRTINQDVSFETILSCQGVPLEGKTLAVYRINPNDSTRELILDDLKTDARGYVSFDLDKKQIEDIIVNKWDEVAYEINTEFVSDLKGNKLSKKAGFKLINSIVPADLEMKINIADGVEETSIDDNALRESFGFRINDVDVKKEDITVIKIKRIKDEDIEITFNIANVELGKDKKISITSEIFDFQESDNYQKDVENGKDIANIYMDIMAQKVNMSVEMSYIKSGDFIEIVATSIKDKKPVDNAYKYIKGIDANEELFVTVDWKNNSEGLVVLKKTNENFVVTSDSNGLTIKDYKEKKENKKVFILDYSSDTKNKGKKYGIKTNFDELEKGSYEIIAVLSNGFGVRCKNHVEIIPEMPKGMDAVATYCDGEYIVGMDMGKGLDIKFPKIPKNIPLLGGEQFKLPIGDIYKSATSYSNKKKGKKPLGYDTLTKEQKEVADIIDSFPLVSVFDSEEMEFRIGLEFSKNIKESENGYQKIRNMKNRKGDIVKDKKGKNKTYTKKKLGTFSVDFNYGLHAVIAYDEKSDEWGYGGGFLVGVSLGMKWTYYYIIPVAIIPVPAYFSAGIDVGLSVEIGFLVAGDNVRFKYAGEFKIGGEVAAGIGWHIIRGEAFGNVTLTAGLKGYFDSIKDSEAEISVRAELGVRLIIDLWLWSKTFKKSYIYKWPKPKMLMCAGSPELMYSDMVKGAAKLAVDDEIEPYILQQVTSLGNELLIVYLENNFTKEGDPEPTLKYVKYSDNTGFGDIKNVCDYNGSENYIESTFDLNGKYMVFASYSKEMKKTQQPFDEKYKDDESEEINEAEIRSCIQYSEVNSAYYENGKWICNKLTNNNVRDFNPKIVGDEVNKKAFVVWARNEDNEIIQNELSKDKLMYSFYNGDKYSSEKEINTDDCDGFVKDYEIMMDKDRQYVVFSVDKDNDLSTIEDNEIYLVFKGIDDSEFSKPIRITDNSLANGQPKVVSIGGINKLIYNENNSLICVELDKYINSNIGEENKVVICEEYDSDEPFDIVESEKEVFLTWCKVVPEFVTGKDKEGNDKDVFRRNIMEVFDIVYDKNNDTWSKPMQVTNEGRFSRYVDTAYLGEKLRLVYSSISIDFENELDKINDRKRSKTNKMLCMGIKSDTKSNKLKGVINNAEFNRHHNLAITKVELSKENPSLEEEINIKVIVKNTGQYTEKIGSVKIGFGSENSNNVVKDYEDMLVAGEEKELNIAYTIPKYTTESSIFVAIDDGKDSINKLDNIVETRAVYPTLNVLNIRSNYNNNTQKYEVYATIENAETISFDKVYVKVDNATNAIKKKTVYKLDLDVKKDGSKLKTGETSEIKLEIEKGDLITDKDDFEFYFSADKEMRVYTVADISLEKKYIDYSSYVTRQEGNELNIIVNMEQNVGDLDLKNKVEIKDENNKVVKDFVACVQDNNIILNVENDKIEDNLLYSILIKKGAVGDEQKTNNDIVIEYERYVEKEHNNSHNNHKDKDDENAIEVEFSDTNNHWANDNIVRLVQKGIITGYSDGTFRPDNQITRAEFCALIVRLLKLDILKGMEFDDTQSSWAKDYISTLFKMGIINGIGNNKFDPEAPITREQMAKIISNVLELKSTDDNDVCIDSDNITNYAKKSIKAIYNSGIMGGYKDGSFRPKQNTTRAEAAKVLCGCLDFLNEN